MARLKVAEHKALCQEWLDLCHREPKPCTFCIVHSGKFAKQTHGLASLFRVTLGGEIITPIICSLTRMRLSKGDLVAVRSSAGPVYDGKMLAIRIRQMHIDAAVRCLDLTALNGLNCLESREAFAKIQAEILRAEVALGKSVSKRPMPRRL